MLTFFRRIRRGLLGDGATSKYLLYAIGEIALVVIGILIALQINNWNDRAKETVTERELLAQLDRDMQKCISDLEGNIKIHEIVSHSSDVILNHMDQNLPYHDSLAAHFASSFLWSRLIINIGAYETIKSHGIEIISNVELRDQIVQTFEGKLFFLRELEKLVIDYCERMRHTHSIEYFKASYVGAGPTDSGFNYGSSVPINYESLKKDDSFRYHLTTFYNLSQTLQNLGNKPYKKDLERLISLMQNEL